MAFIRDPAINLPKLRQELAERQPRRFAGAELFVGFDVATMLEEHHLEDSALTVEPRGVGGKPAPAAGLAEPVDGEVSYHGDEPGGELGRMVRLGGPDTSRRKSS